MAKKEKLDIVEMRWAKGYPAKVPVVAAFRELQKLKDENGSIVPEDVVKAAGKKRSPIHKAFNWDDTDAAHKFRMEQARLMMRCVIVRYAETRKIESRAIQVTTASVGPEQKVRQVYQETADILANPDARGELLARALKRLVSFQKEFRALQELSVVFRAINEVLETVSVE